MMMNIKTSPSAQTDAELLQNDIDANKTCAQQAVLSETLNAETPCLTAEQVTDPQSVTGNNGGGKKNSSLAKAASYVVNAAITSAIAVGISTGLPLQQRPLKQQQ
jgi:hypothetical protein